MADRRTRAVEMIDAGQVSAAGLPMLAGLKAFAGSAAITRATGKKTVVLHRHTKNRRLAAVGPSGRGPRWATPRAHGERCGARRAAGDWNHQAQRHLFNRVLDQLHHCLHTGQLHDEHKAFPSPLPHALDS
ncbi:MAG: hypothetical protein WB967_07185 [Mycobacterium sp.]|uniref:hypothetical protein n=1 Tax=Mycobacterium sp. TaxID=1785 RepID=UPI003C5056CC